MTRPRGEHGRPGADRPQVLVVEDDTADAALAVRRLEASGAVAGCTVVHRLGEIDQHLLSHVDCAVVDLGLPDASGLQAVHRLRDLAPELPLVVLSGLDDDHVGVEALRYGVQDYLSKAHADAYALGRAVRYAVERQRLHARLEHQAMHDALTGLPNRLLFLDRVEQALARGGRLHSGVAVLYADLDQFKAVNDSLGHGAGDELLIEATRRLSRTVRPTDTLARIGGDEFTVLCTDVHDPSDAETVAERMRAAMTPAFVLDGTEVHVTLSVGVTLASEPDADAMVLLRDADTALYAAKEAGRNRVTWFDEGLHARAVERLTTVSAVRRALEHGHLRVAYQPLVDVRDGTTIAYEALVRWPHPERGLLGPSDFTAALEDPGVAQALDQFVLGAALDALAGWRATRPHLRLHVNVSPATLALRDLADRVLRALEVRGLPADALTLEVREGALADGSRDGLDRLRAAGVEVALDGFGAGTSSLTQLRAARSDVLKLDGALVSAAQHDEASHVLLRLLAEAAHALSMRVVAQGVETADELALLRAAGVEAAQGHLWARPALDGGRAAVVPRQERREPDVTRG